MELSIATLLSNFTDDKLVAPKVLEKKLGCNDELSLKKLEIVLDALEKIGILVKERGKYKRIEEEDVVEAKLRCSSKGFCFAIQDAEQSEDIYIRESHLSNAWNGDRVLVRITKEGSRRRSPEGEVRLILERANPSVLARVKSSETGFSAVPLDDRLLFELNLQANGENLEKAIDHLVHVEVLRYPIAQHPPMGKVARVLGSDAEAADEKEIVCCKHDLRRVFPAEVLKAADGLPKKLGKTSGRMDLRQLFTVTFSSETAAEDNQPAIVENALTLEKTPTGAWQVGIHTTDVAHYIQPDTPLDREAKRRGTAAYLGDTCLPLLPEALTRLCSLVPGQDRLAISILLTLDDIGQVVEFEIQPTTIQVDAGLTYQQLQSMLEAKSTQEAEASHPDLAPATVEMLKQIVNLSVSARVQRLQRGAFELRLPEPVSPFPDEGRLGALTVSVANGDSIASSPLSRALLKELFILANQAVSSHLLALSLPGIYCLQKAPHPDELEDLLKLASHLQLNWQLEQEDEVRPSDFQRFIQICAESDAAEVLNYLLKSALKPFGYGKAPGPHFGLSYANGYTHCISPMQRYADLLVQRVLATMFEKGRDRRSTKAKDSVNLRHSSSHGQINWNVLPPNLAEDLESQLASVIPLLNEREKIAMDAEADFIGLKKAEMVKERTGEVFQGMITGVQSYGFFVEIEDLLVEGLVHVSSLKDDWYEFRSRHACLVGRKNRIAYRLGDRVEVQVKSVDYYRQQIDLVTVGGGSEANNEDMETEE
ncbi:MAG: ribonuclease R [Cyanosarcina radialis HA8281-LM2]|jgi:ribonuclease R|nr:ribonuclease R [Cyanosarcina radialis HA8281-LM2]